jgi:hypothetical protein
MGAREEPDVTPHPQLVVLWEAARRWEEEILTLIRGDADLEVVAEIEVNWPTTTFGTGLGQLYGQRLPSRSEKQRHCGTGPFLVVIVHDLDPRPGLRRTPRGVEQVDTHMFDLKQQARAISGGGHRVHATQSAGEFRHDLPVLTGLDADAVGDAEPQVGRRILFGPPIGAEGWPDVATMLGALDRAQPYCVLRNFEHWDESGPRGCDHPDIDLLVTSAESAACALAAVPTSRRAGRAQYRTWLAGREVLLDLRAPGDGYVPVSLAEAALGRRLRGAAGFWIPDPLDHFRTLAYHAVVHRGTVSDDYRDRLAELAAAAGLAMPDLDRVDGPGRLLDLVLGGVEVSLPDDPTVGFDDTIVGPVPGLRRRRAMQRVRSTGGRGLRRLGLAA